jgi:Methane oxygenase PmoA
MNQSSYTATQHLHHDQFGYIVSDPATGRCLGGVGANYYRPWVFPLYTPNGLTVIQEFPFDHPFHNGFWVAQGPIFLDGREVTFWPAPPMRNANEALFTHMGHMETVGTPTVEPHATGVHFTLHLTWRDKTEQPVLDETRTINLYTVDDATICDMVSVQRAAYGELRYAETKFGSIGIRVEPRLLPLLGGEVLADGGRRGNAEIAIDQACHYVAYENRLPNQARFGVLLTSLDEPRPQTGPWFIRDYGLACYSPTRNREMIVAANQSWQVGLRVVAYDGALREERAQQWLNC